MNKNKHKPSKRQSERGPDVPLGTTGLLLGAHMSIAGGLHRAFARGEEVGCTAIQIFTKNAAQWHAPVLPAEEIAAFKAERLRTGILAVAHDAYLINLASPDSALRAKSLAAFIDEMERSEALELPYLVMHPGSHTGAGEDEGLKNIVRSFDAVTRDTRGFRVKIAIENTSGQGTALGYALAHLQRILTEAEAPERLAVCIDTCHAFTSGYDLRDRASYDRFMDEFDGTIGLEMLAVMHLNDCKRGLGSRVDRHEHIGRGALGIDCFRSVMNDSRLTAVPKLIETPKALDGKDMDRENLTLLTGLMESSGKPRGVSARGHGEASQATRPGTS
jgi:deoxyribonuclease IV